MVNIFIKIAMRKVLMICFILISLGFLFLAGFAEMVAVAFTYVLFALLSIILAFYFYFNNKLI